MSLQIAAAEPVVQILVATGAVAQPAQAATAPQSSQPERRARRGGAPGRGLRRGGHDRRAGRFMSEMREQKRRALDKAVRILEQDPTIADLQPCAGAIGGDCIALRDPPPRRVARDLPVPKLTHLPGDRAPRSRCSSA